MRPSVARSTVTESQLHLMARRGLPFVILDALDEFETGHRRLRDGHGHGWCF